MTLDQNIINGLKQKYNNVHPLIFQRCIERSKTSVELFDMLETISSLQPPIMWDEENQKNWKHIDDVYQFAKVKELIE